MNLYQVINYKKMRPLFLLCLMLFCFPIKAETIVVTGKTKSLKVPASSVDVFLDSVSVFSNIHKKPQDVLVASFISGSPSGLGFGYSLKDIWLRLSIENNQPDTLKRIFLEIDNGLLEHVQFYHFHNSTLLKEASSGANLPLYLRETPYNLPAFNFNAPPGVSTILIYAGGRNSKFFPITLYEEDNFFYSILNRDIAFGIFIGVLFAIFFYNLFLFISVRDNSYLYYILYLGTFLFFNLVIEGYLNRIFPSLPIDNTAFAIGSSGFAALFALAFTVRFLDLKKHSLLLYKGVVIGMALAIIVIITAIVSIFYKDVPPISPIMIIFCGTLIYAIAWYCYIKKVRSARFFLIAWTLFLLGTFLISLVNFNALPANFFTNNALRIASMLEVLLLSFALADKINIEKQEKLKAIGKLQQEEKRRQKVEREKIVSELKALKAQMNPHFIFNALNSIQEMFILGNKKSANEQLGKFADLTRMILSLSGKQTISLEEEIDMLEKYLSIEKNRFETNFQYEINIDPEVDTESIRLSPMLLQPFAENAIKHGLFHLLGLKILKISFYIEESYLYCEIEDNGIGRKASETLNRQNINNHESFSTEAIKERIDLLNTDKKEKISFEIIDLENPDSSAAGTLVKIKIPLDNSTKFVKDGLYRLKNNRF